MGGDAAHVSTPACTSTPLVPRHMEGAAAPAHMLNETSDNMSMFTGVPLAFVAWTR